MTEITGGKPLLQKDVHLLIKRLLDNNHPVLIETNETVFIAEIHQQAIIYPEYKMSRLGHGR